MIPAPPSAFLDANVLFSRTLRDWICLIALDSGHTAYQVRWSEDVLAEWVYRMRRAYPDLTDHALGGLRRRLETSFPDAMITGYTPTEVPQPPDLNDWHVLAAAASVPVDFLVTCDKHGLPPDLGEDLGIHVLDPDRFLNLVADRHPALVRQRLEGQIGYDRTRLLKTRLVEISQSDVDLRETALDRLQKAGAAAFAERLRAMAATALPHERARAAN